MIKVRSDTLFLADFHEVKKEKIYKVNKLIILKKRKKCKATILDFPTKRFLQVFYPYLRTSGYALYRSVHCISYNVFNYNQSRTKF